MDREIDYYEQAKYLRSVIECAEDLLSYGKKAPARLMMKRAMEITEDD